MTMVLSLLLSTKTASQDAVLDVAPAAGFGEAQLELPGPAVVVVPVRGPLVSGLGCAPTVLLSCPPMGLQKPILSAFWTSFVVWLICAVTLWPCAAVCRVIV